MIGLIIATHAGLASELLRTAETIVGTIRHVRCYAVDSGADLEKMYQELSESVGEVDSCGDGVLIMTDMFGGTPANISARFLDKDHVEVINGVNLPMLLKFASSRDTMNLTTLATFMKKYGQKSIVLTSDIFFGGAD
ncbi:MAG: PTS system fructose subfamily IIA component [Desulfobacteraceae bacterium 4572_35.1]|nr:MAG: PTS system fructose subfamily IIA component [Desulfobacteraceae bacterium 4572_35.1]